MTFLPIGDVPLTLPSHILDAQVESGACYIMSQWVTSSEWNKRQLIQTLALTLNPNYPLLLFIIKFVPLSWFLRLNYFDGLFTAHLLCEEVMIVRL